MIPLNVGDDLVDREKSKLFLHYLARAAKKTDERELRHRKTEIAVKQLKKLDTERLSGELSNIEDHVQKALRQEKMLADLGENYTARIVGYSIFLKKWKRKMR